MARYKSYNYDQTVMIPVCLENQLVPGSLEFTIHELVDTRVDTGFFDARYSNDETGRPAYDPKVLLKVVLLAYSRGITGSRRIEQACRENITFMALSCGQGPDHSTIAEFVSAMEKEVLGVFRDVLLVCEELDLLGGTHFSLDGLKLPSNASKEWSGTFANLRKKQEKLEEKLAGLLASHKAIDAKPDGGDDRDGSRRKRQLERLAQKAKRIERFLAENAPKDGKSKKEIQSNVTDNESAHMMTSHGMVQGYNAQAFVDAKSQVIVHAEAFGCGQDYDHVTPMLDGAKGNLEVVGKEQDCLNGKILTADSNYHSEGNLEKCEQEKVDPYIPDTHFRKRDPRFATQQRHAPVRNIAYGPKDFRHDKTKDIYVCPEGKELRLRARRAQHGSSLFRRYRAKSEDCRACLQRVKCLHKGSKKHREIAIFLGKAKRSLSLEMIAKIDTPEAREIYGKRLAIVEPVFGNIRSQKGLDHFTLRGKRKVTIQWLLYCTVHNMEKIAHYAKAA
jgi:transposase